MAARRASSQSAYLHLPIIAGIIATAVGNDLLIAEPYQTPHGVGVAMILGGPALYLLGETLFRWRTTGVTNAKRVTVAALLILLMPLGGQAGALLLSVIVAALLTVLAVWELRAPETPATAGVATLDGQGGLAAPQRDARGAFNRVKRRDVARFRG